MYYIDEIKNYKSEELSQLITKNDILRLIENNDNILTRDCLDFHITSSGFVMNEDLTKCLMVYHNLYDSFAWTGGHNDGDDDMLRVAIREAKEETGVNSILKASPLIHLDILPVQAHIKRGKPVKFHYHLNATYVLIADESESIRIKEDENSDVRWIRNEDLDEMIREKEMLVIYKCIIEEAKKLREINCL